MKTIIEGYDFVIKVSPGSEGKVDLELYEQTISLKESEIKTLINALKEARKESIEIENELKG